MVDRHPVHNTTQCRRLGNALFVQSASIVYCHVAILVTHVLDDVHARPAHFFGWFDFGAFVHHVHQVGAGFLQNQLGKSKQEGVEQDHGANAKFDRP